MESKWYETEALVKFASPCNICVIGNTGIGKTFFTRKLLENADGMFTQKVQKIIYFHGSTFQPIFKEMEKNISNIHFYEGLPAEEKEFLSLIATEGHKICVFDDLMLEINNKNWTEKIFTTHGHHKNTTLIYIMQNPFQKGKNARSISINQHYLCLFKSARDVLSIRNLAQQMFPSKVHFFMSVYKSVTEKHFAYILCDLHPLTDDKLRIRSSIFPGEDTIVYVPQS